MFFVTLNYKLVSELNTMLTEEERLIFLGIDQFSGIKSMLADELIFKFNRILKSHKGNDPIPEQCPILEKFRISYLLSINKCKNINL